jgi:putative endonuclease
MRERLAQCKGWPGSGEARPRESVTLTPMARTFFVYILASDTRELYIGVTNDLTRRVAEHRARLNPESHSSRHGTSRLVYFEMTTDALSAPSPLPFASLRVGVRVTSFSCCCPLRPLRPLRHSCRNASTGSIRAARLAG